MMEIFDGTCRGKDAGLLTEMAIDGQHVTVAEAGKRIHRGTRYIRSLVEECRELEFIAGSARVRDWVISYCKPTNRR